MNRSGDAPRETRPRKLAIHAALLIPALFIGHVPGLMAQPYWDMLCTITEVSVNGVPSDSEDIKPGDRIRELVSLPPNDTPPTFEDDLEGGAKGAYWDLEEQVECRYLPQDGEPAAGQAGQSRVIIENGPQDLVGADSIEYTFSIGAWNIGSCGFGLLDADGQALDTHDKLPEVVNLSQWDLGECFVAGADEAMAEEILARGRVTVVAQGDGPLGKRVIIFVNSGDEQALIDAVEFANLQPTDVETAIEARGDEPYEFTEGYQGSENAIPVVTSKLTISLSADVGRGVTSVGPLRFARVSGGSLTLLNTSFEQIAMTGFSAAGNGGTLLMEGDGELVISGIDFRDGFAGGDGSVVWIGGSAGYRIRNSGFQENEGEGNGTLAVTGSSSGRVTTSSWSGNSVDGDGGGLYRGGTARLLLEQCEFKDESAGGRGGAVAIGGENTAQQDGNAPVTVKLCRFGGNTSGQQGCDLFVNVAQGSSPDDQAEILFNTFEGSCSNARVTHFSGRTRLQFNTLKSGNDQAAIETAFPQTDLFGTILQRVDIPQLQAVAPGGAKTLSVCAEDGAGALRSLGYNISTDDSCVLDQPTDQPNTDPMLSAPDQDGISEPLPGSPAIDSGPAGLVSFDGNGGLALPCGWKDIRGLGRPQDGDEDGVFECDAGAVEYPGGGMIQAGHSGAIYNPDRDNEGQFVEILSDERALIYTFSYRPDGSGPAWLFTDAKIVGNSLVSEVTLRPTGTSFGDGFDPDDVKFEDWGGVSMILPGCAPDEPEGITVYSGNAQQGYEPLVTRAVRLAELMGCSEDTEPAANAGLSGSYFDASRNGEGVIVEWLPDGRVLVVMFTYDLNGDQMWIYAIGPSDGNSAVMPALYPEASASWGSGFDNSEILLEPWGTITMTWSDCDNVVFEYDSIVPGYGQATRNYTRLSTLQGEACALPVMGSE